MSRQEKRKRKSGPLRFLASFLVIVLLIGAAGAIYVYSLLKKINTQDFPTSDQDLGISAAPDLEPEKSDLGNNGVVNIALFGVDQRADEATRSDTIIVLSINKKDGTIKLSSIMRDSLVSIEGYGQSKINTAYAYGGPQLAVKTLNQNFGLDIREYVTVNFQQMAEIIDALGGVEIAVSEEERQDANNSIREQAQVAGLSEDYIDSAGLQTLSGTQAVAYSRIRYVGNADFERTSRQREVLRAMFDRALNLKPTEYLRFAQTFFPMVETSLDIGDVLSLADILLKKPTLEDVRFPTNADLIDDGVIYVNGQNCLYFDIESTGDKLHDFIYNNVNPATEADLASDGRI